MELTAYQLTAVEEGSEAKSSQESGKRKQQQAPPRTVKNCEYETCRRPLETHPFPKSCPINTNSSTRFRTKGISSPRICIGQ
jgi:hypothetical protein